MDKFYAWLKENKYGAMEISHLRREPMDEVELYPYFNPDNQEDSVYLPPNQMLIGYMIEYLITIVDRDLVLEYDSQKDFTIEEFYNMLREQIEAV